NRCRSAEAKEHAELGRKSRVLWKLMRTMTKADIGGGNVVHDHQCANGLGKGPAFTPPTRPDGPIRYDGGAPNPMVRRLRPVVIANPPTRSAKLIRMSKKAASHRASVCSNSGWLTIATTATKRGATEASPSRTPIICSR